MDWYESELPRRTGRETHMVFKYAKDNRLGINGTAFPRGGVGVIQGHFVIFDRNDPVEVAEAERLIGGPIIEYWKPKETTDE